MFMGLSLAAGTTVLVSPWILHRDSSRWQEPEAFKPERWLPLLETRSYMSELSSLGSNGAYVPFGAGPRNCIGTGFAMMEALLVLACILRKVQFRTVPGDAFPTADPRITLRPSKVSLLIDRLEMQTE
jgi:cytochrome P450